MSASCARTRPKSRAPRLSLWRKLQIWTALRRQRRALGKLDAKARADIGITKCQALAEANRPMWDVPQNWRQ